MRITVVCSHMLPARSPEAAHAAFLCEHLADAGVDVTLVTSPTAPGRASTSYEVVDTVRSWEWPSLPRLWLELRRSRPDVILLLHVGWIYGSHPMVTFAPLAVRLTSRRTAFVTQFENLQTWDHPRWTIWLKRLIRLLPRSGSLDAYFGALVLASDRLIFLSDRHRDEAARRAPRAGAIGEVIPAPPLLRIHADPAEARRAGREVLGLGPDDFALVYIGYVYRGKGLDVVLRALRETSGTGPLHLLVLGGITDPDYRSELDELEGSVPAGTTISWLGDFAPDEVEASQLLFASDLCVLPFDEGVLLNNSSFAVAAAHGLPILTTRGAGTEPALLEHDAAWLVPPRDPTSMAMAIDRLRTDEQLRERLSAGASAYASHTSAWGHVVERTLATLHDAVAGRNRRRR